MDAKEPAPPLAAWVVAAAVIACAVAVSLADVRWRGAPASNVFLEFNGKRIRNLSDAGMGENGVTVVLLGTSALKYATRDDDDFARSVSSRAGIPVRVLRIVNNWGVFGDFVPLTRDVLALHPDIVLMEKSMLLVDRPWWRNFSLLVGYLGWRLRGTDNWDHRAEDPELVQFDRPCWHVSRVHSIEEQQRRKDEWVVLDPTGTSPQLARAFVEDVRASGGTVELIDIPRRPDFESTLGDLRRTRSTVSTPVAALPEWQPPELGPELYCDVTHVSPAGRDIYSDWLEEKLADAIRGS